MRLVGSLPRKLDSPQPQAEFIAIDLGRETSGKEAGGQKAKNSQGRSERGAGRGTAKTSECEMSHGIHLVETIEFLPDRHFDAAGGGRKPTVLSTPEEGGRFNLCSYLLDLPSLARRESNFSKHSSRFFSDSLIDISEYVDIFKETRGALTWRN